MASPIKLSQIYKNHEFIEDIHGLFFLIV